MWDADPEPEAVMEEEEIALEGLEARKGICCMGSEENHFVSKLRGMSLGVEVEGRGVVGLGVDVGGGLMGDGRAVLETGFWWGWRGRTFACCRGL
jgi:hypothetical protein